MPDPGIVALWVVCIAVLLLEAADAKWGNRDADGKGEWWHFKGVRGHIDEGEPPGDKASREAHDG